MNKVLVILGPTASGKSDLGVALAKKFDGEVISADSRQVYKGLDIGTGKITKSEMQGIPHHLLDVANTKEQFTASDYKELGEQALRDVIGRNKLPIIVGGTGFYIDILACTINFPEVPPNKLLREKLSKLDTEELLKMLEEKDPARASTVDQHNKPRIIRALEIVEVLGTVPKLEPQDSPHEFIYIGILPEQEELDRRIRERLTKRLPGMVKEAKKLHEEGLTFERMHELGLEYKFLAELLEGNMNEEEMVEKLHTAIRQYSKRQMTWFKKNDRIKWFTLSEVEGFKSGEEKEIVGYLSSKLE